MQNRNIRKIYVKNFNEHLGKLFADLEYVREYKANREEWGILNKVRYLLAPFKGVIPWFIAWSLLTSLCMLWGIGFLIAEAIVFAIVFVLMVVIVLMMPKEQAFTQIFKEYMCKGKDWKAEDEDWGTFLFTRALMLVAVPALMLFIIATFTKAHKYFKEHYLDPMQQDARTEAFVAISEYIEEYNALVEDIMRIAQTDKFGLTPKLITRDLYEQMDKEYEFGYSAMRYAKEQNDLGRLGTIQRDGAIDLTSVIKKTLKQKSSLTEIRRALEQGIKEAGGETKTELEKQFVC